MTLYVPSGTAPLVNGALARIERRLPQPGEVLVRAGQRVEPEDVVARAYLPGTPQILNVARALQIEAPSRATLTRAQAGTRAVLRVQDGCDEHCTFCATTQARGANRSRTIDSLVTEAELLSERHAEIVITGVHIGTYGADIGTSLGVLAERLVRAVPSVRFRLSSIEATELDE